MTEHQGYNKDRDGRHDFHSATVEAGDEQLVDDRGHAFQHGRVSPQDEVEQE